MRSLRAAVITLVAALALSACNGGDDPPDPKSTGTPTGTVDVPSTPTPSAQPTAPVLPEAAKKATEAGARAFITYYWDVVNYAQTTGDVKVLKSLSAPSCEICQGFITDLNKLYDEGGHLVGGANNPTITQVAALSTKSNSLYGFRIEINLDHDSQTIVAANGSKDEREAGANRFSAFVQWIDNRSWRTDALDLL